MALEAAGLGLAVVGILMQTFESTYKAYNLITGCRKYEEGYLAVWSAFENQREHFISWGERLGLLQDWHSTDPTPERRLLEKFGKRRYDRIAVTLSQIERLLKEAEAVNNKYGLLKIKTGRKVMWQLNREADFEKLVKKLKNFNSDLKDFTTVEAGIPALGRGASAGVAALTQRAPDPEFMDVNAVRRMRFAAHDFDTLLDDSRHFSNANLGLLLKLHPNRFLLEEKEMALQKIPEWLELQMRQRPRSAKFMLTLIPQIFDEKTETVSDPAVQSEKKNLEEKTVEEKRARSPTPTTESKRDPSGTRKKVIEVKLLFESFEVTDGKRSSNMGLKHIAVGLEKLSRPVSQSHVCQHCNDLTAHFSDMGVCLGGFRGVATKMNHFVYKIPNMPHPAQRAVSLEDLLPGGKHASILSKAPIPLKRIRLVYLVALSFLQLYETPWFPIEISPSDIMFSVRIDGTLKPSITQPFLRRRTESTFSRGVMKTREMLGSNVGDNEPPSTKATDFDDGAFHLGLLIFQILTWLPKEERQTLVYEAKKTRSMLRTRLPVYTSNAKDATFADPMVEFGNWMKKRGLLAALKSVLTSAKYMHAVRLCLLGGFGKENQPPVTGRKGAPDPDDEMNERIKYMEEDFWTRVVSVLDPEVR